MREEKKNMFLRKNNSIYKKDWKIGIIHPMVSGWKTILILKVRKILQMLPPYQLIFQISQ